MASRFIHYASLMALFFNSASAQSITFSSPTSQLLNIAGPSPWTMTATLSLTSDQASKYYKDIAIRDNKRSNAGFMCRFNYTICQAQPATSRTPCRCTSHTQQDYSFSMRGKGVLGESQNILEAVLDPKSSGPGTPRWKSTTVTLPLMYHARITSGTNTPQNLFRGKSYHVQIGHEVTVSAEFPTDYTTARSLTVDLGSGNVATGANGSVTLTPNHNGGKTADFTLVTGENTDTFTFNIVTFQVSCRSPQTPQDRVDNSKRSTQITTVTSGGSSSGSVQGGTNSSGKTGGDSVSSGMSSVTWSILLLTCAAVFVLVV